jgi:hypothetical protein
MQPLASPRASPERDKRPAASVTRPCRAISDLNRMRALMYYPESVSAREEAFDDLTLIGRTENNTFVVVRLFCTIACYHTLRRQEVSGDSRKNIRELRTSRRHRARTVVWLNYALGGKVTLVMARSQCRHVWLCQFALSRSNHAAEIPQGLWAIGDSPQALCLESEIDCLGDSLSPRQSITDS